MGRLCLLATILLFLPELLFVVLNLSNASCLNHKVYEVIILTEKHAIVSSQQAAFFSRMKINDIFRGCWQLFQIASVLTDIALHTLMIDNFENFPFWTYLKLVTPH